MKTYTITGTRYHIQINLYFQNFTIGEIQLIERSTGKIVERWQLAVSKLLWPAALQYRRQVETAMDWLTKMVQ